MREQRGPIFSPVASRASAMRARTTADATQDQETTEVDIEEDESYYVQPRPHTSVRTYVQPGQVRARPKIQTHPHQRISVPPTRQTAPPQRITEDEIAPRKRGLFRSHPVLWLGIGMVIALALWQLLSLGVSWWQLHQDDSTYGRPRTAQYDQVVGHNDDTAHPSHFIALNLNSKVIVIELPGGDTNKARLYNGPQLFGTGSDLYPVTLSFRDRTGSGKPEMIVHVQGDEIIYQNVQVNGVWQFVPQSKQ